MSAANSCSTAPTASYPQAFAPTLEAGAAYNVLSYSIFDKVLWQASASQINRWRKHVLRIKPTSFEKMQQRQVPFIYNFSQAVVPMPLDWSSNIHISGYWFLDQPDAGWEPEESLLAFMQRARNDNVPLIYVGFGSITIKDVEAVTEHIYEAALTADVRVILSKGWSARAKDGTERKIQLKDPPPNVYLVDAVPHVSRYRVYNRRSYLNSDYLGLALPSNRCCHAPWGCWNNRSELTSRASHYH